MIALSAAPQVRPTLNRPLLGDRLRLERERQEYTQQEFADAVGVSRQLIARIEVGEGDPSLRVIVAMCYVLGVSADWLLGIDFEDQD